MEVVMSYLQKYVFQKKSKDINDKVFNLITYKNDAKTMTTHISCYCECKLNCTTCNSYQKLNNKTCQCECKNHRKYKKDYSWNPSTYICHNSKHLKSIVDTLVISCYEIISVMDIVSTKLTNSIAKKGRYK